MSLLNSPSTEMNAAVSSLDMTGIFFSAHLSDLSNLPHRRRRRMMIEKER